MKSAVRESKLARTPPRYERVEARVTGELKRLFQEAAALRGLTLSDFILNSVHDAAVRTVEQHKVIRLNREASIQFAEALLRPPEPNPRLRAAARRYHKVVKGR